MCSSQRRASKITIQITGTPNAKSTLWRQERHIFQDQDGWKSSRTIYFNLKAGKSVCDMLTASQNDPQHEWSPDGISLWDTPNPNTGGQHQLGGSADGWPTADADGFTRRHLSFWGDASGNHKGVCCYSTKSDDAGWQKSFEFSSCQASSSSASATGEQT